MLSLAELIRESWLGPACWCLSLIAISLRFPEWELRWRRFWSLRYSNSGNERRNSHPESRGQSLNLIRRIRHATYSPSGPGCLCLLCFSVLLVSGSIPGFSKAVFEPDLIAYVISPT